MDGSFVLAFFLGLIAQCALLYFIISAATKSNKKVYYDKISVRLLMKIAEQQGVKKDEIDAIVKEVNEETK